MMRREYLIYILLGLVTLALFAPVASHEFISLDDPDYVTENPPVKAGLSRAGIVWAFTKSHSSNWHPLTWISHMLDCQLYGLKPAGHHITNLLFHVANTLLLFGLLRHMTGAVWRSAFVAALFAWHPMHVESVAWVAERKDVLSTFFWLLTMLAYWRYASESKVQSPRSKVFYGLALVCFALGLTAKPMLVTLPFVLLLMDFWPLGRIYDLRLTIDESKGLRDVSEKDAPAAPAALQENRRMRLVIGRLLLEKVPFFVLAAVSSVITYLVQREGGSVSTLNLVPFHYRVQNMQVGYFEYVQKMFWPYDMAIHYPLPAQWPAKLVMAGGFMLMVVSFGVVVSARRRPYLAVGWFWFVGTLVPVIGLVRVGAASMADRYTYIPGIGLFIMVTWGVTELAAKRPQGQWFLRTAGAAVLAVCALVTSLQLRYWKDTITLFEHALAATTNNTFAYYCVGSELLLKGQREGAIGRFQKALALDPHYFKANREMALALEGQGKIVEATAYYREALRQRPNETEAEWIFAANCRMAQILDDQGKTGEAIPYYREALRQKPDLLVMLNNLAWILAANPDPSLRDGPEAVEYAERACKLTHYETPFYIGTLAAAYAEAGRFKEAVEAGTRAHDLATSLGMKELAQRNEELLKLYRANHRAYEKPKEPEKGATASGGAGK